MGHRFYRQIHQVLPVIERYYLYVFREYILIQFFYLIFQICNDFTGILPFTHHHNSLNDIVLIHSSHLSETGQAGFVNICQVLYENRCSVDVLHYDVSQFIQVVYQTDSPDYVCLRTFRDDISSYIDITLGYRVIKFERGNSVINQLMRIHAHFECLHLATETDDISYT